MLRTFPLAGDDDARRQVREAHGGFGAVDVLPARAGRAVDVHAQILVLDFDVDVVFDVGDDVHARERGVPALVGVEGRNAHEAMHAAFRLGVAVGVFAVEAQHRRGNSRAFAVLQVFDADLEAATLAPARIHAHEHSRPVAGLRAARARFDHHDRGRFVVRTGKKRSDFQRVDFLEHRSRLGVERGEFIGRSRVVIAHFADELGERLQILRAAQKRDERRHGRFQRRAFGNDRLRRLLVVPKIRLGHFRFQLGEASLLRGNVEEFVKMTSAADDFVDLRACFR